MQKLMFKPIKISMYMNNTKTLIIKDEIMAKALKLRMFSL